MPNWTDDDGVDRFGETIARTEEEIAAERKLDAEALANPSDLLTAAVAEGLVTDADGRVLTSDDLGTRKFVRPPEGHLGAAHTPYGALVILFLTECAAMNGWHVEVDEVCAAPKEAESARMTFTRGREVVSGYVQESGMMTDFCRIPTEGAPPEFWDRDVRMDTLCRFFYGATNNPPQPITQHPAVDALQAANAELRFATSALQHGDEADAREHEHAATEWVRRALERVVLS